MEQTRGRPRDLKAFLVGMLIGISAQVPGISGAVVAVCFGIYERLVRDVAALRIYVKRDFWFLLFLTAGAVVGVIMISRGLSSVMNDDAYRVPAQFLFVGLIFGQTPAVYRMAEPEKRERPTKANIAALAIGLAVMLSLLVVEIVSGDEAEASVHHNGMGMLVMFTVGMVVAISALVPGISHSTILIVFGLFTVFTDTVGNLDIYLLVPLVMGLVAGALGFSKAVHLALERHHRMMGFLILGLTIGSLVTLSVTSAMDIADLAGATWCALALTAGTMVALWFVKLGRQNPLNDDKACE